MPVAADPLTLLQQHITEGSPLQYLSAAGEVLPSMESAASFSVAGHALPVKTPTSLTRGAVPGAEAYPLDALLFFWQHRAEAESTFREYAMKCFRSNIASIQVMDFRKILTVLQEKPSAAPIRPSTTTSPTTSAPSVVPSSTLPPVVGEGVPTHAGQTLAGSSTDAAGAAISSSAVPAASSSAILGDLTLLSALAARQLPVRPREAYLGCSKSLLHIRKRVADVLKSQRERAKIEAKAREKERASNKASSSSSARSSSTTKAAHASSSSASASSSRSQKGTKGDPIILVPAAATSLINLYNVKEFLMGDPDANPPMAPTFVDAKVKRALLPEKPTHVIVSHVGRDGISRKYRVIDHADNLSAADWNLVVAAFVTGQAWQFKMWKWKDPQELFHNVKGFYVKWSDDTVRAEAKNWNIHTVEIHREKRHTDRAAILRFWDQLLGNAH